jgi:hypothetical protein
MYCIVLYECEFLRCIVYAYVMYVNVSV